MRNYIIIHVEPELLSQVLAELLSWTTDPNTVEVVHDTAGRVIHVDPLVADAWYQSRLELEAQGKAPAPDSSSPASTTPEPAPAQGSAGVLQVAEETPKQALPKASAASSVPPAKTASA